MRRAAIQLLEGLAVMRVCGAGGAPAELPAEPDMKAIEAAAADALVIAFQTLPRTIYL